MQYVVCHARLSGDDIIVYDLFFILYDLTEPHGVRGDIYVKNLSTRSENRLFKKNPFVGRISRGEVGLGSVWAICGLAME
jgi:hypothetical protein